jgi:hypothetical protein
VKQAILAVLACALPMGPVIPRVRAQEVVRPWPGARASAVLSTEDDILLDELQRAAFRYFQEQSDPVTGLVRDRALSNGAPSEGKSSIAACGFALSAWAVATQRGWVTRPQALAYVKRQLRFLATKAPRRHGFFYHFMDMDTGARAWKCEVSPIDTGLFLAGAILAREYFHDPDITALVNKLSGDVDWEWFLNSGQTLAMDWHDEHGFSRYRWDQYSEATMLSFLGMGAIGRPLPNSYWDAWARKPVGTYAGLHFIEGPPLFIHQFTHAYVDFRFLRDGYADYYHNSILASLAQRQMCIDLRPEFPSWGERLWGITSSDSIDGYKAWGGPPRTEDANALDGTIVPCAAAGSVAFVPNESMTTLRYMRAAYGDLIWSRYGFVDAFNPETGWVDPNVIGIDLGITLLQCENARTGLIWAVFMQAPEVQRALARAGFVSQGHILPWADQARMHRLASQVWKSIEPEEATGDTLGLRLSAALSAAVLGLIPEDDAEAKIAKLLKTGPLPVGERAITPYAASLVTLRNAIPQFAQEATARLKAIDWSKVTPESNNLGSASRLAVFFQVANGVRPPSAWYNMKRASVAQGHVYVLEPAQIRDQMMPGLWLDERSIVTGASASQLAYAIAVGTRKESTTTFPFNVQSTALLVEQFPAEVAAALKATPLPQGWLEKAPVDSRCLLLISLANLLAPECMREWFQQDELVLAGRKSIGEFAQAAFGGNNSVYTRNELSIPIKVPPQREADAVPAEIAADKWQWVTVKGMDYKVSNADVRPGDPDLELRFALTWDSNELHFHAEAMDTPAGFFPPTGSRSVELFINPRRDGLVWRTPDNFQFAYRPDGSAMEWFHNKPVAAHIQKTGHGYTIESDIRWADLGITPHPGMLLGVTANVSAGGTQEWDPMLELSWRYYQRDDDRFGLGTIRLASAEKAMADLRAREAGRGTVASN